MTSEKRTLEVTTDPDEADSIVCLPRIEADEDRLVKPVGHGTCSRCGQAVVFRDIYPGNIPKICVPCITLELDSGIN